MGKYITKRLLHGIFSVIAVVIIVMILIYGLMSRNRIFAGDAVFTKQANNNREIYRYQKWEEYGYLDYVPYADYLIELTKNGEIDEDTRSKAVALGRTADKDSETTAEYVEKFTKYYESQGYTVKRCDAVTLAGRVAQGGSPQLYAYRDHPLIRRLVKYFTGLITIDNIHKVPAENDIGKRGLTFTLHDPVYGGEKFSPAIIGNGTYHKYLLYVDSHFPYIHQNFYNINLGLSYSINQGVDVYTTMTRSQGPYVTGPVTYPTGLHAESADDLHTATYLAGSLEKGTVLYSQLFTDDYTVIDTNKSGYSKLGYSFIIGIISVIMAYVLGLPIGLLMSRHKDGFIDKLGTVYIVFIIAVPSLAYIFLFKSLGGTLFHLPTSFNLDTTSKLIYVHDRPDELRLCEVCPLRRTF